jgi:hypothetical protein
LTASFLLLSSCSLLGQTGAPSVTAAPGLSPSSAPIPKYLVYLHFLSMVDDLDKKATAAGATDPYQFAHPFSRAGLQIADLDALRSEAKALKRDLSAKDQQAKSLLDAYRASAQAAIQQGQPLPPLPPQIYQLQAERDAIAVYHMTNLQAKLGQGETARLEGYFAREVTPHVSLKVLAHPPANAGNSATATNSSFAIQP